MKYNPDSHHRRSIRLKGYDYSGHGAYFITICTHDKKCLFGDIVHGQMKFNQYGEIVKIEWLKTFEMRKNLALDEYMIMPNHFHGIINITDNESDGRGTLQRAPTFEQFAKPVSNSIPTIIRLFKSTITKQINELRNTPGTKIWQQLLRTYHP
ncbi:MAG: transposase [Nitrospinota bacterium]